MLSKSIKKEHLDADKMLLLYMLLFLPVLVSAQGSQSMKTLDREMLRDNSRDSLDWIGESFLKIVETFFPVSKSRDDEIVEGTNNNNNLWLNIAKKTFTHFQVLRA